MSFNFYHIRSADFFTYAGGGQREIITRENYEAYFVMYVDDELSAAERKAVENFLQQHPDLEEELVMLQQSVLRADEHIIFEPKELLFKGPTSPELITEHNYQEYFVLYGDDELTNEEKDSVEQFVYQHPEYQVEFELIQQAKLVPDNTLAFPDKTYLYRTEEDESRIIAFPWWRFTAAAVALLVIGSLTWYIGVHMNDTEVASQDGGTKLPVKTITPLPTNSTDAPLVKDNMLAHADEPIDPKTTTVVNTNQEIAQNSTAEKIISKQSNKPSSIHVTLKSEQQPEPPADKEKRFSGKAVVIAVGNSYEPPVIKNAIIQQTINEPIAVHAVAEVPDDETDHSPTYVLNTQINKTPLRGFFRKVSRVVDKVTNDDNGKGGIRIANLAIALK